MQTQPRARTSAIEHGGQTASPNEQIPHRAVVDEHSGRQAALVGQAALDPTTREFYCQAIRTLREAEVPFLVGGAYAFERYTGIARHTKDFDIFVRPKDLDRT